MVWFFKNFFLNRKIEKDYILYEKKLKREFFKELHTKNPLKRTKKKLLEINQNIQDKKYRKYDCVEKNIKEIKESAVLTEKITLRIDHVLIENHREELESLYNEKKENHEDLEMLKNEKTQLMSHVDGYIKKKSSIWNEINQLNKKISNEYEDSRYGHFDKESVYRKKNERDYLFGDLDKIKTHISKIYEEINTINRKIFLIKRDLNSIQYSICETKEEQKTINKLKRKGLTLENYNLFRNKARLIITLCDLAIIKISEEKKQFVINEEKRLRVKDIKNRIEIYRNTIYNEINSFNSPEQKATRKKNHRELWMTENERKK